MSAPAYIENEDEEEENGDMDEIWLYINKQ